MEDKGFHSGRGLWARKERECSEWWYGVCVINGSNPDQLSVPCAMWTRCMYAAGREDMSDYDREVLDAWAHKHVCLIGYSPLHAPDRSVERLFG